MSDGQISLSGASDIQEVALQQSHSEPVYLRFRNVVEWPVAALMVLVASPLIGLLALAAKLTSKGPAFYTQIRLGRHGRPFSIYKIRTMLHDCESKTGAVWCSPNDRRLTPIGEFLRDTHLDELPQLINVLQGHMSLIGPRPERPEMVAKIERDVPSYRDRLLVRPGLTGLAQVRLPADIEVADVRNKLAYDLFYVRHVGLGLDLSVLIGTFFHLIALGADAASAKSVKRYASVIEEELVQASAKTQEIAYASAPVQPVVPATETLPEVLVVEKPRLTVMSARARNRVNSNGNGKSNGKSNGNGVAHEVPVGDAVS